MTDRMYLTASTITAIICWYEVITRGYLFDWLLAVLITLCAIAFAIAVFNPEGNK